jgi:hypothetical protein
VEPGIHIKDVVFDDVWRVGWPKEVLPSPPRWDRRKNEIVISRAIGKSTIHHDVEFSMAISFGKVPAFCGLPALPVLRYCERMIKSIVMATEEEARRIGIN